MREDKKLWSNRYDESNLDNEDWLTPAPYVLDNVKKEIGGKRNRSLILFLFLITLALGFGVFLAIQSQNQNDNKVKYFGPVEAESATAILETKDIDGQPITNVGILTTKYTPEEVETPSSVKTESASLSDSKNNQANRTKIEVRSESIVSHQKVFAKETIPAKLISPVNKTQEKVIFDKEKIKTVPVLDKLIEQRNKLTVASINNRYNDQVAFIPSHSIVPEVAEYNAEALTKKSNNISVEIGYSNWAFGLNDNFTSTLLPADFSHGDGNGIRLGINYEKGLTDRVFLRTSLGFSQVDFVSGHNSTVIYDVADATNTIDITMATPLGFIESDVVLEGQDGLTESQEVLVDLDNEHTLRVFDVGQSIGLSVIDDSRWRLNLSAGLGINYLVSVENRLSNLNTDNSLVSFVEGNITKEQTSINTLNPSLLLGANAKFSITDQSSIGVQLSYSSFLNSIYEERDFSTSANVTNFSMSYNFSF